MLFSGIKYLISSTFSTYRQDELAKVLDANGALRANVDEASHVITNTLQFEGEDVVSEDARIVTDEWVDRSVAHGKQQDPLLFSADHNMIFSGIIACAADLEACDKEVISAGINALGGLYREGYTRDCTHVLAARPGSDKYKTAMHFKASTRVHIVLPHWFDDCFKLLTRLPEEPYEWPDPPMLRRDQKFKKARLPDSTKALVKSDLLAEKPEKEQIQALTSVQTDIWHGKKILLSASLGLDEGRRSAVEVSIKRAGGIPVELHDESTDIDNADVLITQYREGSIFAKAIRAKKTIGTLSWLFHVHGTRVQSLPQDQLLHFPCLREPVQSFTQHKITVTNYEGDARRYLKKLIELMGAEFTPQMTSSNTIVIAAFIGGDKTTKAREWNIPIVHHKWLEDCFSSWSAVTPAQPQYVEFPAAINFGNLVGRRAVEPLTEEDLEELERADGEKRAELHASDELDGRKKNDVHKAESQVIAENAATRLHKRSETHTNKQQVSKGKSREEEVQNRAPEQMIGTSSPAKPGFRIPTASDAKAANVDSTEQAESSRLADARSSRKSRAGESDREDEASAAKSVKLNDGRPSRLKRRVSSLGGRTGDESKPSEQRQSPKKAEKTPVTDSRKPVSLFDLAENELLTGDDDVLPDKIGISPKANRRGVQEKAKKDPVGEEEENVDPAVTEKVGPPRGKKKVASPHVAKSMKALTKTLTVEIPVSPSKLNRMHSLVAVASDGPTAHSSPKRGRPKKREVTEDTDDDPVPQPAIAPVTERTPLKRSAAAKATMRLHEIAPDMLKFEQELRTGNIRGPWENKKGKGRSAEDFDQGKKRRVSVASPDEPNQSEDKSDNRDKKKRKVEPSRSDTSKAAKPDPDGPVRTTALKNAKLKRQVSVVSAESHSQQSGGRSQAREGPSITMMTTKVSLSDDILKDLLDLGVKTTSNPSECTLLVTNSIGRTEKFLCVMATAKGIVTDKWAVDSVKAKRIMPPEDYALKDPEGEAKHHIKLSESLRRAQSLGRKLLDGHSFYVTKKLQQSDKYNTYRNVIVSAGGKVVTQAPNARTLKAQKDRHLLSLPEDAAVWQGLADEGIRVYVPELVLTGILAQKMEWGSREYRLDDNP